jgi:hypothetical protein
MQVKWQILAASCVSLAALSPGARADIPRTIAFHGALAAASGEPKPDGTYHVSFRLFDAATGGSPLWSEPDLPVVVSGGKGLFAATLGSPTWFGNLPFNKPYFLGVQVQGDPEMTPRLALASVPYALTAGAAGLSLPFIGSTALAKPDSALSLANIGTGAAITGQTTSGIGVQGSSFGSNSFGVYGTSADGIGVGAASDYVAVYGAGTMDESIGVSGDGGAHGSGVSGFSYAGRGVNGSTHSGSALSALTVDGNLLLGQAEGHPNVNVFRVDATGRAFANGGYQAGGADVAEFIASSDEPAPGDVVEIDRNMDGRFRKSRTPNSTAVAGVISTLPGMSVGATRPADAENAGPQLALVGRVPVNATAENGPIRRGDLLTSSSTPGYAMRAPLRPAPGTIIGKALSPLGEGKGRIQMLVMLR